MRTIRLKIADLYQFDGQPPAVGVSDVVTVTPLVMQQFAFLPQPLMVTLEGDPNEAFRLAETIPTSLLLEEELRFLKKAL